MRTLTLVLLLLAALLCLVQTQPLSRAKRVSDQRLAELETLIALAKMKGKLVTVPVGFGLIDPAKLGRRRRSLDEDVDDALMEHLARDLGLETVNKFPLEEEVEQEEESEEEEDEEFKKRPRGPSSSSYTASRILHRLRPLAINRPL